MGTRRGVRGLVVAAAVLLSGCGGESTAEPTPSASATSTATSTATAAASAPVDGATLTDDELVQVRRVAAVVDGDLLLVEIEVAAWPDAARADLLVHYINILPEGYEDARPPVVLSIGPEWVAGPTGAWLQLVTPAEGQGASPYPVTLERDEAARTLRATTRWPQGWPPIAQVLFQTTLLDQPRGQQIRTVHTIGVRPAAGDLTSDLPILPGASLAAPIPFTPEAPVHLTGTGEGLEARLPGLPLVLAIPNGWTVGGWSEMGFHMQDPGLSVFVGVTGVPSAPGATPREALDAFVADADGAMTVTMRDDLDLSPFVASVLVRVEREIRVEARPGRMLEYWYSPAGNVLRIAAIQVGDSIYLGYVEAASEATVAEHQNRLRGIRAE